MEFSTEYHLSSTTDCRVQNRMAITAVSTQASFDVCTSDHYTACYGQPLCMMGITLLAVFTSRRMEYAVGIIERQTGKVQFYMHLINQALRHKGGSV
jgi:hypothetical protein